ncbi:hypothetical protein CKAH01_07329 [Colletotrichum kahawae]|uniref:Uncharacterized protein n=1 Tax=Colletotrichum kahawae TaxID=34407 RepID=A0AAD9Y632_COLKA|nr:hypothetical protein CKAH01_07329 [Colletotrichum kahawae]
MITARHISASTAKAEPAISSLLVSFETFAHKLHFVCIQPWYLKAPVGDLDPGQPRPAPYSGRNKKTSASNTGTKKSKSNYFAQTFTSSGSRLVDIAEAPRLTSIFVGWPKAHYEGAAVNKDNIPVVLAYFAPQDRVNMRK